MVSFTALAAAALVASASAFAPAPSAFNRNVVLNAEKSQALPFLNRPALVSNLLKISTSALESFWSSILVTSCRYES
jgi:hypothetical protein